MEKNNRKMTPGKAFLLGVVFTGVAVVSYNKCEVVRTACKNVGQCGKNLTKRFGDWIIKVTTPKN
jgi:hypothetical protein